MRTRARHRSNPLSPSSSGPSLQIRSKPATFKILTNQPADNGNRFLCLDCRYSLQRSALMHEVEIFCTHPETRSRIRFVITQCDMYSDRTLLDASPSLKDMLRIAHYAEISKDTGRIEFMTYSVAEDYGYDTEVKRVTLRKFNINLDEV